ncbi:hypothetical protein FZEAL_10134 [Fusarium zealandicum]|uniref:Xylanolytic transcriptional activator regulatory domain-containing protein n=1 Tax=Fusarium zealandicum TaxID=1053134 RepID=A0A8H4U5P6_9HYPO|nr:hypothetical protein FZEAL_10134 [Fusarium zealandicum]
MSDLSTQKGKVRRKETGVQWVPEGKQNLRLVNTRCQAATDSQKAECNSVQHLQGEEGFACDRCISIGIGCVRPQPASEDTRHFPPGFSLSGGTEAGTGLSSPTTSSSTAPQRSSEPIALGQLPTGQELNDLIELYFSSVHPKGRAPQQLTLLMIANAMRFASTATTENLARADAWADAAIGALLPRVYQGFGAIQLMSLLLAQHYDLNRGNFTSAWLMGATCARMMQMMSLQTFDRTYENKLASDRQLSPLLSSEALRRVAWSTFYSDSVIDGGRYGFHVVDEQTYRLQLPCERARFLGDEMVVTETLSCSPLDPSNIGLNDVERAPLDMSAYLLRTAAARRRALHFAFRASHKEQTVDHLSADLDALKAHIQELINALPRRFQFNNNNMFLHRSRLVTFLLLHILRHNLFIVLGRASLMIYSRDPERADRIPQTRRDRISHALPIASLITQGLNANIAFDPQIGIHAYIALEILLFEPCRLAETDPLVDPKAPELLDAISPLLTVIRNIASRSEYMRQLHVETVYRLTHCGMSHLLSNIDLEAFSLYQPVGQDAAEYDFRDFRWAKVERLQRGASSVSNMAHDESLLEYKEDVDTSIHSATSSPKLDAIHTRGSFGQPAAEVSTVVEPLNLRGTPDNRTALEQFTMPWHGFTETESESQGIPLDWLWLLGNEGV